MSTEAVSRPSPARSARMTDALRAPAAIPRFLAGPSGTDASVAARLASRLARWLGTWAASVSCNACAKAATA